MDLIFKEQASIWDTEYRINRAKTISNKIKSLIRINKDDSIIDFGAGTGLIGLNFIDTTKHITFIEKSIEMVNVLKKKISVFENSDFKVFDDLLDNGISENSFDLIMSSMVFHHIKDIIGTGTRLYDLLKQGKNLCIVDLISDDGSFHENEKDFDGYNGFDPIWLSDQFIECGFKYKKHEIFFSDFKQNGEKEFKYSLFILIMEK
jgi:ubiquinone/menaquinone biosynthesis C-methylase UbiE